MAFKPVSDPAPASPAAKSSNSPFDSPPRPSADVDMYDLWRAEALANIVVPVSVALAYETDFNRLLERMLIDAMSVSLADGGTLYLRTEDDHLRFTIMRTRSLGIALGGTTGRPVTLEPIPLLHPQTREPNHRSVAAHAAHSRRTVNVADVYAANEFDFSGPRQFDQAHGYRTKSLLAIPLRDNHERVTGVVQLINARGADGGEPAAFGEPLQRVIECLCLLAGAALVRHLRQQELEDQVQQLRIEVDRSRRDRHVQEIAGTDYFRSLQGRAREFQQRVRGVPPT